jgi:hypothetical protein
MILVLILILTGCATEIKSLPEIVSTNDFCKIYEPMLPSRKDTKETAEHVFKYYKIWKEKCHNSN